MLSIYSFLQPQEPISARAEEADKLSVIIDANKSFENSQPYFTRDGKMVNILMGDVYLQYYGNKMVTENRFQRRRHCWW